MNIDKSGTLQNGFIMVLALIILSLLTISVTQFSQRSGLHWYFDQTMIDREYAKQLAMSGIQIAFSQIAPPEQGDGADASTKKNKETPEQYFIGSVAPLLNQWQTFALTLAADGVAGTIKIYLSCEVGKINLNKFFNFAKHAFEVAPGIEGKKMFEQAMRIVVGQGAKRNLSEAVEKFLKQRNLPLNDATEFARVPELSEALKSGFFPEPIPSSSEKKVFPAVALLDLLTVWNDGTALNPLVLSDATCALFGLQRSSALSLDARKKIYAELAKKDIQKMTPKELWDAGLQKLYGKEFGAISKDFSAILGTGIRMKRFSVVSYGSVGAITQRLCAIIEQGGNPAQFVVKKLYWI